MSEMSEEFQRAHLRAHNDWHRNFVLPYGSAYSTAWNSFKTTLDNQEKADAEARAQAVAFAMFALSLCGGSVLTAVFGKAAMKVAASQIALDVICNREMERAFKAAHFISNNKTASFALGTLWDKGEALLSDKLKNSLVENTANFPSLAEFATLPQNMQNHLEKWVRDAYARVLGAEEDIFKQTRDTIKQDERFVELMKAPFFKLTPVQALNEGTVSDEIETVFFMKFMLDMDYIAYGYWEEGVRAGDMRKKVTSTAPINENPMSARYPTYKGPRDLSMSFQEIRYKDPGAIMKARIDELAKKRSGASFFRVHDGIFFDRREATSKDVLRRAQTNLQTLANRNYDTIVRTLPR